MNATVTDERAMFLEAMKANPGDATTLMVAADYFEERGDARTAGRLREIAPRVKRAWAEWEVFSRKIAKVDPAKVRVVCADRHMGQVERAAATRELFRELGIPGVSVTSARGSMCFWVEVRFPARLDDDYLWYLDLTYERGLYPSIAINREMAKKVTAILYAAFPEYYDRSDPMTDYYNNPWSIGSKSCYDYEEKPKRVKKAPAPKPEGWDGWPVITVGGAEYKVEKLPKPEGEGPSSAYKLYAVKGTTKYVLMRNFHRPHVMYVVNVGDKVRGGFKVDKVRGHGWFTDKDGILKVY